MPPRRIGKAPRGDEFYIIRPVCHKAGDLVAARRDKIAVGVVSSRSPIPMPSLERRRSLAWCLPAILAVAFALRLALAWAWPNFYRPDEIFQTLEPAYRLITGWGVVSWEWRAGIRSWLYPALLAGIMDIPIRLGFGRAVYLPLVMAAMSLVALLPVWAAWRLGERSGGRLGAVVCALLVALSPELVYFGPKTLTEVQAGNVLAAAVALATLLPHKPPSPRAGWSWAGLGALLGIVFCLRFHLTPALALVALAAARLRLRERWLPLLLGAAVPLALLGIVDQVTLGSAFQSVWKNFSVNVTEGRSLFYGQEPAFWYGVAWAHLLGIAALPMALLFCLGASLLPLAAACGVLIVLTHSLVAHKELSFIYAAFPLAATVAGAGLTRLALLLARWRVGAALAGVVVLAAGSAASGDVPALATRTADLMASQARLHGLSDMCGLVMYGPIFWPSYALMDRNVPVVLVSTPAEYAAAAAAGNYILIRRPNFRNDPSLAEAKPQMCWKYFCLLRRPGTCTAAPYYDMNRVLERTGK
jgi:phosphatidylinositol glycan class B